MLAGTRPGPGAKSLSLPRKLTEEEAAWVAGPQKASKQRDSCGTEACFLPRPQLLQAFGVDEASLLAWAARARRVSRKAARQSTAEGNDSSEDEGEFDY